MGFTGKLFASYGNSKAFGLPIERDVTAIVESMPSKGF
jgi:hypothetical protein